jgi:tetratricopeptide (TPR) repeat protein
MIKMILATGLFLFPCFAFSQLTTTPSGGNKKASVTERIGLTDVTIHYNRPGVKGREGKIWGSLIPPGFIDQGFGSSKAAPWRAGSNENTTITFSTDVKIDGHDLAAGTYGFFIAYDPGEPELIFSKNYSSWGSFYYDEKEDALRVKVKPHALDRSVEWLKYEFSNQTDSTANIQLQWEKLSIPFTVEVNVLTDQLESFRKELRTDKGFTWSAWNQAAQWCLQHKANYPQALQWADSATGANFGGNAQFAALSTKAQLLAETGQTDKAMAVMKTAIPLAQIFELHQYGRQLITYKKTKEALEIFKLNAAKNPRQFTTYVGLARGYAANGDYKSALKNAQLALPMAPDPLNKGGVETMIVKLKEGKDIN